MNARTELPPITVSEEIEHLEASLANGAWSTMTLLERTAITEQLDTLRSLQRMASALSAPVCGCC